MIALLLLVVVVVVVVCGVWGGDGEGVGGQQQKRARRGEEGHPIQPLAELHGVLYCFGRESRRNSQAMLPTRGVLQRLRRFLNFRGQPPLAACIRA